MKKKFEPRAIIAEMPGLPGRFSVLRQYVDGGPTHTDSDFGKGYTAEDASAAVSEFIRKGKTQG